MVLFRAVAVIQEAFVLAEFPSDVVHRVFLVVLFLVVAAIRVDVALVAFPAAAVQDVFQQGLVSVDAVL